MSITEYPSPAIEHLYSDHHPWLKKWLWNRLGDATDAAYMAHDVFLRLILKPAPRGFGSEGEARAYLRTMAQGMCINLWHRREIEKAWLETLAARPEEFYPSAEHQAAILEALHEVGNMLLDLPPKAARAFLLAEACQMTDNEVAAELGVSSRMVRKYITQAMLACMRLRAKQSFADLLQD